MRLAPELSESWPNHKQGITSAKNRGRILLLRCSMASTGDCNPCDRCSLRMHQKHIQRPRREEKSARSARLNDSYHQVPSGENTCRTRTKK